MHCDWLERPEPLGEQGARVEVKLADGVEDTVTVAVGVGVVVETLIGILVAVFAGGLLAGGCVGVQMAPAASTHCGGEAGSQEITFPRAS